MKLNIGNERAGFAAKAMVRLVCALGVAGPMGVHARDANAPLPVASAPATLAPITPLAASASVDPGLEASMKFKFRCADGEYRGPEPGKKQWAKDEYTWAVSRDFAKRFCMPESMVSDELKGAEAVAFRVKPSHEATCRIENGQEVCRRKAELQLELYLRSDLNLPKSHPEVRFYQVPRAEDSSALVIGTRYVMGQFARRKSGQWTDPPGQTAPFHVFSGDEESRRVKFMHVEFGAGNLAAAGADFTERYYQANWVDGIDLIRLGEGAAIGLGTLQPPSENKQGIGVIRQRDLPGCGSCEEKQRITRDRYAPLIEFPRWLSERIYAYDKQQGDLFMGAVKRALGAPGAPSAPDGMEPLVPPVTR